MTLPLIDTKLADLAVHGSFCPKLCSHTCPVLRATGRDEATPWSLHRVVSDIATGRTEVDPSTGQALHHCTGCHACATACAWEDQDVPAQVRSGRAAVHAVGADVDAARTAIEHVGEGRTPDGHSPLELPTGPETASVVLVAGCRDRVETVSAFERISAAAGDDVRIVVPPGCCGSRLDDLGAIDEATTCRTRLDRALGSHGETRTVVLDPHCLPSVRAVAGGDVVDVVTYITGVVSGGRVDIASDTDTGLEATWHDPCVLARTEAVTAAPRHLLGALGIHVTEPEGAGVGTHCSGAGMEFPRLEPEAAAEVAGRRSAQLRAAAPVTVTACPAAREHLGAAGLDVRDLVELVAARIGTVT